MADKMSWQVRAVTDALHGADPMPPVIPVLCFVAADWPMFGAPDEFRGVRLESIRSIKRLLTTKPVLNKEQIADLAAVLLVALPPK